MQRRRPFVAYAYEPARLLRQELLHSAQLGDSQRQPNECILSLLLGWCRHCITAGSPEVAADVVWDHIVTDVVLILQLIYASVFHSSLVGLCFSSATTGSTLP